MATDNLIRFPGRAQDQGRAVRQGPPPGLGDLDALVQEKCAHNAHRQTLLF